MSEWYHDGVTVKHRRFDFVFTAQTEEYAKLLADRLNSHDRLVDLTYNYTYHTRDDSNLVSYVKEMVEEW